MREAQQMGGTELQAACVVSVLMDGAALCCCKLWPCCWEMLVGLQGSSLLSINRHSTQQ